MITSSLRTRIRLLEFLMTIEGGREFQGVKSFIYVKEISRLFAVVSYITYDEVIVKRVSI